MTITNRPASAATDVTALLADLDGGQLELALSRALSDVAAAVVDHGTNGPKVRTGTVKIEFTFEHIKGTHQVTADHRISFNKPTSMGKASEETEGATVLHVGKYGALSITQARLNLAPDQSGLNLGN
jgi:hypothetical protein